MIKNIPTDQEILETINTMYAEKYFYPTQTNKLGAYIEINCADIAAKLKTHEKVVFGRFYSYLNRLHSFTPAEGKSPIKLFTKINENGYCIHFPLMLSILSSLREIKSERTWTRGLSIVAICISILAAGLTTYDLIQSTTKPPTAMHAFQKI